MFVTNHLQFVNSCRCRDCYLIQVVGIYLINKYQQLIYCYLFVTKKFYVNGIEDILPIGINIVDRWNI